MVNLDPLLYWEVLMMKYRTFQEYKEEVFDKLTDEKKLIYMYDMSKQLCDIRIFSIHNITVFKR